MESNISKRQSPNICFNCRRRKVRCDGRRDTCGNCKRLELSCLYPGHGVSANTYHRIRARQACLPCREKKARCNGEFPTCLRCGKLGFECAYPPGKTVRSNRDTWSQNRIKPTTENVSGFNSVTDTSDNGPPETLVLRALEVFFRTLHYIPVFSFMHQAVITESYRAGVLDKALVLALVGLTSSLADLGPGTRELGTRYIDEAESILLKDMESPKISKVQALILVIKHRENARRFGSVFMLTAIAARFVTALRLNYEHKAQPFLTREGCRRLLWSLFMIDTHIAGGYQDFALLPADIIHVQLPCHEDTYKLNLPSATPSLHDGNTALAGSTAMEELSPLAQVIRVRWLRHRVLAFTKKAAVLKLDRSLDVEVRVLQDELDSFLASLPPNLHFSEDTARLHSYSNTFSAFATIHIVWYTTHCILYRLTMHGIKEALPSQVIDSLEPAFVEHCRRQCLEKSRGMAEVFRTVTCSGMNMACVDLDMAVNAYQCARMLFYLYRMMPGEVGFNDLQTLVGYCETFVNGLVPDCEALRYIRQDMKQLISQRISVPPSPNPLEARDEASHTHSALATLADVSESHHILSRHSLIGQMNIVVEKQEVALPPLVSSLGSEAKNRDNHPAQLDATGAVGQNIAFDHMAHDTRRFDASEPQRRSGHVPVVPENISSDIFCLTDLPDWESTLFDLDSSIWLSNSG